MKRIFLPLFWKFTIVIIAVVALFGTINAILIWQSLTVSLQKESQRRGFYIANNLADQAIEPLLDEDFITLQNLVGNIEQIDSTIVYAFIIGKYGNVIVHNFSRNVPKQLLTVNSLQPGEKKSVQLIKIKDSPNSVIRDISFPVLEGKIGTVRVGILENSIQSVVKNTILSLLFMVGAFLGIGILGAFVFSHLITSPIKSISKAAENLDLDTLILRIQPRVKIRKNFHGIFRLLIRTRDELDFLAEKFNNMIERLENAYSELENAHMKLSQSEKLASVGRLVAGLTHEINNPVAGIQNCIRRIQKDPENTAQNLKYLNLMEEATAKIERVVRGLLDYTRQEKMIIDKVKITDVTEKALSLVAYKLEKSQISITKEIPRDIPPVPGSFNHLEQVFVNLFLNSIDAINEKCRVNSKCIKLIKISAEPSNSHLTITLEDSGNGIAGDELKKIFDPFYTTKDIGEGTGLGLSVCYKIIKSHKGTIKVDSKIGKGATFSILLPLTND